LRVAPPRHWHCPLYFPVLAQPAARSATRTTAQHSADDHATSVWQSDAHTLAFAYSPSTWLSHSLGARQSRRRAEHNAHATLCASGVCSSVCLAACQLVTARTLTYVRRGIGVAHTPSSMSVRATSPPHETVYTVSWRQALLQKRGEGCALRHAPHRPRPRGALRASLLAARRCILPSLGHDAADARGR
jgi:hypothetical protein